MRQHLDPAYVLRTRPLGDADLIVSLLTESQGLVRGVAKSARASRRRFGGALEPMTRVSAGWTDREGRDLHRIDSLEPLRSFAAMQSDPTMQAACACLTEINETFGHPGETDSRSFRLLGTMLEALEGGLDPWVALRYFEFWTLRLHGLFPDLDACNACEREFSEGVPAWITPHGSAWCVECLRSSAERGVRLGAADREFLMAARTLPPERIRAEPSVVRSGSALDVLLRATLESFAERRFLSYRHLRAMGGVGHSRSDDA